MEFWLFQFFKTVKWYIIYLPLAFNFFEGLVRLLWFSSYIFLLLLSVLVRAILIFFKLKNIISKKRWLVCCYRRLRVDGLASIDGQMLPSVVALEKFLILFLVARYVFMVELLGSNEYFSFPPIFSLFLLENFKGDLPFCFLYWIWSLFTYFYLFCCFYIFIFFSSISFLIIWCNLIFFLSNLIIIILIPICFVVFMFFLLNLIPHWLIYLILLYTCLGFAF